MVSMSGTNWAAAAAANNNDAGYGYHDEDMPPANATALPLRPTLHLPSVNYHWTLQPRQSSPRHVNVNDVNMPSGPPPPAFPQSDGNWLTSHGRSQAHPSVPGYVFLPMPQQQPHQVHEQATPTHVQPMHNRFITPSPNFDMAYDVGFEQQRFSASVYQRPPTPATPPPYAYGYSSPSSQESTPKGKVLFVHNVPSESTEDELRDLFSRHGTVVRVSILRDTGSIAFVHFRKQSEADEARLSLNNHPVSKMFGFVIITYASIL